MGISAIPVYSSGPAGFDVFCNLHEGTSFKIHLLNQGQLRKEPSGTGRVIKRNQKELTVQFEFSEGPDSGGIIHLEKPFPTMRKLKLTFQGNAAGTPRKETEWVEPDSLLLTGRILKFNFDQGKRFFQLSVNSRGQTVLVTDFGSVALLPER